MSSSWIEHNRADKARKVIQQRTGIPSYDIRPASYIPVTEVRKDGRGYNIQRLETDCESIEKYLESDPSKALFIEAKSKQQSFKSQPRYARVVPKGS